ncbi:A disintegrin and metalloproteinase with thrombospondin motifs adt-1-like isoform X2 [Ornithodoros turicata]|uniref:A disintegrin and metalloproteinase with thrombospondin motifs adt-1-like isoform X2 n=1 Tax=Ornithodoros turicata TaxID=34597 RepID=UPI00313A26BB
MKGVVCLARLPWCRLLLLLAVVAFSWRECAATRKKHLVTEGFSGPHQVMNYFLDRNFRLQFERAGHHHVIPRSQRRCNGRREKSKAHSRLVLEVGAFCDEACYRGYIDFLKSKEKLRDIMSAVFSQLQVYFKSPSVALQLDLKIVHMEILEKQPLDLPTYGGDSDKLLESFSQYQKERNPRDGTPGHWDVAVLFTGLDMTHFVDGQKSSTVVGKSWVNGFCEPKYSGLVIEFGASGPEGVPAMSSGIQASHVLAHELGHNLGLYHDGPPKNDPCMDRKFLMSSWKSHDVLSIWSKCSRKFLDELNRSRKVSCLQNTAADDDNSRLLNRWKLDELPGQRWDADEQCKIFLKDDAAQHAIKYNNMSSICRILKCRTPKRMSLYGAGGALEGSYCGGKNWCQLGKCTPFPKGVKVIRGGWTDWTEMKNCTSSCLQDSVSLRRFERSCTNPQKKNTEDGCEGDDVMFRPCNSDMKKECQKTTTNKEYIATKCEQFSKIKPDLHPPGTQLPYDQNVTWRSCAIYCSYKGDRFINAKFSTNDVSEVDTYLPDGARCHADSPFYCQNRQCSSLLRGMHGMHKETAADELTINVEDWVLNPEGRKLVKEFLEYVPGRKLPTLKKIPRKPYRIYDPDDVAEKPR